MSQNLNHDKHSQQPDYRFRRHSVRQAANEVESNAASSCRYPTQVTACVLVRSNAAGALCSFARSELVRGYMLLNESSVHVDLGKASARLQI